MKETVKLFAILALLGLIISNVVEADNMGKNHLSVTLKSIKTADAQCESIGDNKWAEAEESPWYHGSCEYFEYGGVWDYYWVDRWGMDCFPGESICEEWQSEEVTGTC